MERLDDRMAKTYCPKAKFRSNLKNRFGITVEEYNEMSEKQNNSCAICKNPETKLSPGGILRKLCVDHCHTTGKIRQLLCCFCNTSLGLMRETPEYLKNMIDYIYRHNTPIT